MVPLINNNQEFSGNELSPLDIIELNAAYQCSPVTATTTTEIPTTTTYNPLTAPFMPTSTLLGEVFEFTSETGPCRRIQTPSHPGEQ